MNNQQKQQVLEQVKSANNVLVAVNSNPTVDELAASVGLTLALNRLGKHATTVFSGVVPSTIEFLQPEKTIETTTDSLRDFIIALDKSKADKLRYKVENDVVRIFITPYRTSISDRDLEFSQGDFNVDVVIAIGVTKSEDLDRAVTAHGRILHDATVISLTKRESSSELGSINWQEPQASSLCEMVAVLTIELDNNILDGQMATAFMTGIIAETDRFRNERTTPLALSLSSQLMSSGANQQLIADKLEAPEPAPQPLHQFDNSEEGHDVPPVSNDGELTIAHDNSDFDTDHNSQTEQGDQSDQDEIDKIHIDEHGNLGPNQEDTLDVPEPSNPLRLPDEESNQAEFEEELPSGEIKPDNQEEQYNPFSPPVSETEDHTLQHEKKVIQPPVDENSPPKSDKPFDLNEALQVANGLPIEPAPIEDDEADAREANLPETTSATESKEEKAEEPILPTPQPIENESSSTDQTLSQLEQAVDSPHVVKTDELEKVEEEVNKSTEFTLPAPVDTPQAVDQSEEKPIIEPPKVTDPTAPPLVPPPMTAPQFFDSDGNNDNPFLNPKP